MSLSGLNIEDKMRESKVPGVSLSVIEDGQLVISEGYGVMESGSDEKVDSESLFHACSMSKFVTTFAVLKLAGMGLLNLDEDINHKLKSWKIPQNEYTEDNPVTLRLLLSHQGGIKDAEGSFDVYLPSEGMPELIDILDGKTRYHSKKVEAAYRPGSAFEYSDAGFCIIEQLLVDTMGKSFSDLMNEQVLEPLGMSNSLFMYPDDIDPRYHLSCGHDKNGQIVLGKRAVYPYLAAAGLWTTTADLGKLIVEVTDALSGKGKSGINKELMKEMVRSQRDFDYAGLGVFIDNTDDCVQITSQGWGVGFQCLLMAFPKTGQGAVVMINAEPGKPQSRSIVGEIMKEIGEKYNWPRKVAFVS